MLQPTREWKNPKNVTLKKKKVLAPQGQENSCPGPITGENGIPIGTQVFGSPLVSLKRKVVASNEPLAAAKKLRGLSDVTNAQIRDQTPVSTANQCLPQDWSLKTKVRFTSQGSFSWVNSIRTQDEAAGIAAYVKGTPENKIEAMFQKSLMVWMHPNLPFVQLYPRVESKVVTPSWIGFSQSKDIVDSLWMQWSNSFRSLYQQLKSGHCTYFYLCANTFTVLFLSMTVNDETKVSAYLTPTTSGLRQALSKDGIEYTFLGSGNSSSGQQPSSSGHNDSEDTSEDEFAANNWLNSMGLLMNTEQSRGPKAIVLQQSRKNKIDGQAESLVKVEGLHVHGLFNYLLNCKSLVTTTGAYTGVPPTLLAPTAFDGATLQSLKFKHCTIQDHRGEKPIQLQCLDVSGPILPQNLTELCALLGRSQDGNFVAHSSCVEASTAFNCRLIVPNGCQHEVGTLREIVCHNNLYQWT